MALALAAAVEVVAPQLEVEVEMAGLLAEVEAEVSGLLSVAMVVMAALGLHELLNFSRSKQ
jgi:hypothetical protein